MEILSMNVVVSAIVDPWVTTLSFVVALAMRIQVSIAHQMKIFCTKHEFLEQCIAFFDRLCDIGVFCESGNMGSFKFAHQAVRQKV